MNNIYIYIYIYAYAYTYSIIYVYIYIYIYMIKTTWFLLLLIYVYVHFNYVVLHLIFSIDSTQSLNQSNQLNRFDFIGADAYTPVVRIELAGISTAPSVRIASTEAFESIELVQSSVSKELNQFNRLN